MRYIKLSTEICKWEWFTDGNMLKLWIYLLTNAQQFKETKYKGLVIRKGQVIVGRKKLAQELSMSEQQIRSCINRLKSTNEITTETTNKYTLITIVNYDKYQSNLTDINQQNNQVLNQRVTNKQPTNNQQITTSNKDKREREKESNNSIFAPSDLPDTESALYRLPLNTQNTFHYIYLQDIDHYKELYPAVDVEQEIRKMIGWLESNPKNRKTASGIKRFINNWLSKEQNSTRAYSRKEAVNFFDVS